MIEQSGIDPRGDLSAVDPEIVESHVSMLSSIMSADIEEWEVAEQLRAYIKFYLNHQPELWMCVSDKLAADKICSKAIFRRWLEVYRDI
jgi:hypothetical protein